MMLGAFAAGFWLYAGGSFLAALGLYALFGTAFVLGTAILTFLISELAGDEQHEPVNSIASAD